VVLFDLGFSKENSKMTTIAIANMAIINAMVSILGSFCHKTALIAPTQKQLRQIVIRLPMFSRSNWQ
jgi:hypothetical protein